MSAQGYARGEYSRQFTSTLVFLLPLHRRVLRIRRTMTPPRRNRDYRKKKTLVSARRRRRRGEKDPALPNAPDLILTHRPQFHQTVTNTHHA